MRSLIPPPSMLISAVFVLPCGCSSESGGSGTGGAAGIGGGQSANASTLTTAAGSVGGATGVSSAQSGGTANGDTTSVLSSSSEIAGASTAGGSIATGGIVNTGGTSTNIGTRTTGGELGLGGTSANVTLTLGGTLSAGGVTGASTTSGVNTGGAGGSTASPNDLWIAIDGADTNPGTETLPLATLAAAHTKVSAGQTIWLKPGTYNWSSTVKLTKNGTESSPINVFAAPGARPVIDFSAQTCGDSSARGIQITGTYWHLKGFDVQKAGDNCIHIGGSHNTIEWVSTHNCCDSGLQITADTASDASRGAYNTVLNCDSYENCDTPSGGENADGFSPKLHIGPGNVFRGCRAWNNSDDGFDLFASDDVVVIDDCWAFLNGKLADGSGTTAGDGNGFKLGGAASSGDAYEGGAPHEVTHCFAFENTACGFTRNNNTSVPVLTSCAGRDDGKGEFCSIAYSTTLAFTMMGNQAKAVARNPDGSLPPID